MTAPRSKGGKARDARDSWTTSTRAHRWHSSPSVVVAGVLLIALLGFVLIAPFTPRYDPYAQNLGSGLMAPFLSGDHPLGTDSLGRDIFSRMALAGQISLLVAVSAVAVSFLVGVTLGLVAGFFKGPIENFIMGLADVQLAIPRILLLIAVVAVVGPSISNLILMLGLTGWIAYARVARAMALSLREREFVLAALTQGASSLWNIRKHLLPNVLSQMIILASFDLGQIIVLEASLSYLGLGVQAPLPSWGLMISEGQTYLQINPWLSTLPGVAIFMLLASIQFLSQRFTAEGRDDLAMVTTGTVKP